MNEQVKEIKNVLNLVVETLKENPDMVNNLKQIVETYSEVLSPIVEQFSYKGEYQKLAARVEIYNQLTTQGLTHTQAINVMGV